MRLGITLLALTALVLGSWGALGAEEDAQALIGIGAQVTSIETDAGRMVKIEALLPDSPAAEAGLAAGDIITHVDGTLIADMALVEVVRMLRGEADTKVVLTVTREGEDAPLDFEVTRREIMTLRDDDLAQERAEGMEQIAQAQGDAGGPVTTVTMTALGGPVRHFGSGMGGAGPASDMVTTEEHTFVLRGDMLHQFKVDGMEPAWERDLRTTEELEWDEKGVEFARGMDVAKVKVEGDCLYALRKYTLYQFALEDMEEVAQVDLRTDEEKEQMTRTAEQQAGQGNPGAPAATVTMAIGGPGGRVQYFGPGMGESSDGADMVTTEEHVFVLRAGTLFQFQAEDLELVWQVDLRTGEERELAEKGIILVGGSKTARLAVEGDYLYALRDYMLHEFRLEDMAELAAIDLRTDEEKQRVAPMIQFAPMIQRNQ